MTNPTPPIPALDSKFRLTLKNELLEMIRKRHPAIDRGLQFEGVSMTDIDEKGMSIILVLQDILQQNRDLSIVQWPGGIALVRTQQVDALNDDYRQVNENANFIIRGATDKTEDLLNHAAVPTGYKKEN